MTFFDIAIVYLACGSPFAVHSFLHPAHDTNFHRLLSGFTALLSWPVRLIALIGQKFYQQPEENPASDPVEKIRTDIERLFPEDPHGRSVFEWREVFDRYAGLARAVNTPRDESAPNEIFRIAGQKNDELANICLNRRNRKRLEFHHIQARNDFLSLVSNLSNGVAEQNRIRDLAIELVDLLKDDEAMRELEVIFTGQNDRNFSVSNTELEAWKPPAPNEPIGNRI